SRARGCEPGAGVSASLLGGRTARRSASGRARLVKALRPRPPARAPATTVVPFRAASILCAEGAHDFFGEESGGVGGVAAEEFDEEVGAAEAAVAVYSVDDLVGGAPDAVLFEVGTHVGAVELWGALERFAGGGLGVGDHHQALL